MARHDIATYAQALTLRLSGTSDKEVLRQTGVKTKLVHDVLQRAMLRGFDPQSDRPVIRDHHIQAHLNNSSRKVVSTTPYKSVKLLKCVHSRTIPYA